MNSTTAATGCHTRGRSRLPAQPADPHIRPLPDHRMTRRAALGTGLTGAAMVALAPVDHMAQTVTAQEATPMANAGAATFSPEEQLALTTIVETSLAQTNTPGAVVGVWYPGRGEWTYAAGIQDLTTAAPTTTDSHVRIASITKTFTATVILQLVDEGQLSFDDTLEPFVPGIANGDQITIRQVLGMTAGIFNYVEDPIFLADFELDPVMAFTPQDAVEIMRRYPADFAPGEDIRYSDSNYILLGLIIEQLTGQTADVAITERVIRPLGLTQTVFATTPDLPDPFVRGYEAAVPGATLRDMTASNPYVAWTAGAMYSTLSDLRVWAKALADGSLLSPAIQQERLTFNAFPGEALEVGYGLGILSLNGLIGHNGGIFGYSTWMVHAPEEDATVVVATNRANNDGGTADPIFIQIAQLLFPERFASATTATPAAAPPGA